MKRVGYGRVSTAGQARNGTSLAEQKKQLMAAGVAEEDIYLDAYTGTKMHRPQFDACMAALEPDDEFVACKLDRFARTATEGTGIVRDLVERGIRVNVLNMGIADNTPMGEDDGYGHAGVCRVRARHDRGTYPVRQGCTARD